MSEIKFTPEQEQAIYAEDSDILVSAAAGSGKTAVLTRRVLNKITDPSQNKDITDFLVVTFTVSAANDLKKKLSDGIRELMKKDGADVSRLRRQLLSLSYAKISTIDSFCNFIVKDNVAELGLGAGMSLGDESEIEALSDEIMNEVVEEFYTDSDDKSSFILLAETFSDARGDWALVPALTKIYKKLICHPCPMTIIPEYLEIFNDILLSKNEQSVFKSPVFYPLIDDINRRSTQALELFECAKKLCLEDDEASVNYIPAIENDISFASLLVSASKDSYESFAELLDQHAPERLKSIKGRTDDAALERIKEVRASAREIITSLKSDYIIRDEKEIYLQLEIHVKILEAINEVITCFHTRFMEEKKARKIMSFSDMSHFAFASLVVDGSYDRRTGCFERTPYAESLGARFSEILIDEYQDVNELQDLIFRAVSNSKNRFMVGDIKQSIYAFRGATPDIFKKYRDTFEPFKDIHDTSPAPKTIFLQNNFRSDSKILEFSNLLFGALMNFRGNNYRVEDRLVYSRNDDSLAPVDLVLLQTDSDSEEGVECEFVADEITRLLREGKYLPSEIAVLARATASLEKIKASLEKRGVSCDATGEKSFFESFEILSLTSFMKVIVNPLDDVYLATALTMTPFSLSPNELLEIRDLSKKTDLYFAVLKACELTTTLGERCRDFIKFLDGMQAFSGENSAERVMWKIIEDTELLCELEKLDNSKARKNNVIFLYSQAQAFCKKNTKSLGALCDYFDSLQQSNSFKGAKGKKENAVKLMTFHSSKGLEFPVCFAMGLGRNINKQDSHETIVFSDFGPTYALPFSQTCTKLNSYLKKSASCRVKDSLIEEELRNLYVTLTRAQKKLYVTAVGGIESIGTRALNARLSQNSFNYSVSRAVSCISLIMSVIINDDIYRAMCDNEKNTTLNFDCFNLSLIHEYTPEASECLQAEKETFCAEFQPEELDFALSELEDDKAVSLPYKISVSEIKNGEFCKNENKPEIISAPDFVLQRSSKMGAFVGTSMHTFMQFCSFELFTKEDCIKEGARLVRDEFILPEHEKALDYDKLYNLFSSPLFDKIRNSPLVEREKRYTLMTKASDVLPDLQNDTSILVQGVVDCYFEDENKDLVLIDFKTDRVGCEDGKDILLERHSEQLKLYAEALCKITGKKVSKIYIWSFSLSQAIEVRI